MRVYRAADAPPGALDGEAVAVLGYGNLGRSAALNLRTRASRSGSAIGTTNTPTRRKPTASKSSRSPPHPPTTSSSFCCPTK